MPTRYALNVGPIPPELLAAARTVVTDHATYDARKSAMQAYLAAYPDTDIRTFSAALSREAQRLRDDA